MSQSTTAYLTEKCESGIVTWPVARLYSLGNSLSPANSSLCGVDAWSQPMSWTTCLKTSAITPRRSRKDFISPRSRPRAAGLHQSQLRAECRSRRADHYRRHGRDPAWQRGDHQWAQCVTAPPPDQFRISPAAAAQCRGRVTGNDWRDPTLWKRYAGHCLALSPAPRQRPAAGTSPAPAQAGRARRGARPERQSRLVRHRPITDHQPNTGAKRRQRT